MASNKQGYTNTHTTNIPSQGEIPFHGRLISAVLGGVMTSTLMTPFDVVKTRIQAQVASNPNATNVSIARDSFEKINCKASPSCFCSNGNSTRNPKILDRISSSLYSKISKRSQPAVSSAFYMKNWNSNLCILDNELAEVKYSKAFRPSPAIEASINQMTGTWESFRIIARTEGLPALWRGLSLTLIGALPSTVTYFAGYDILSINIKSAYPKLESFAPLIAGMLARTATAILMSPLELARTKMQSASSQKLSVVVSDLKSLIRTNGLSTLWAGLVPTLYRDVPFSAIYWLSFEQSKAYLNKNSSFSSVVGLKHLWLSHSFVAGAASGTVAAIITHPFDVIKTARQTTLNSISTSPISLSRSSVGILSIMRNIIAKEGSKGFYSGLAPRLMKIAPACAIMISSYEFGKSLFSS